MKEVAMLRKLLIVSLFVFAAAMAAMGASPAPFQIMTQNMDAGTDMTFAIAELQGYLPPGVGVELTYQEILATNIPQRAALIAARIAKKKPDLLALQEATLWRTGSSSATATSVLFDQLDLLRSSLAAAGVPYDLVAVNSLMDIAFPKLSGGVLRITDRDALLIRADLRPPEFHVSEVHANSFDAVYSLGVVQVRSGWISAMVHTGNRHFRLATTHLQGPVPGDPTATAVQMAQAKELLGEFVHSTVPVVLAGDFNSDAILGTAGPGPDNTGTAALIQASGYMDAWPLAGAGPGATWPLYLEDQFTPTFFGHSLAFERIDLIFEQGLNVIGIERVLAPGAAANQWPYFGSDHAGVLAVLSF
jgi:endonuclease/exonuclease/phosphatase (EEP) superfamily protein YafD